MTNSAAPHLLPVFARVRPRFRAWRRLLADRDQWRALSRFHLRRRGECARPCPSGAGRGVAGAGDEALAHVEPVPEPGRREARRAAVQRELRGLRVLLQFRRRSAGMRDQDRAPLSRRQGPSGALSHHHLRRRLPWPHAGDAGRDRLGKISRRFRPADGRLRPGAAWRSRGGEEGDRSADRRHPDRADPGRGRRAFGDARLPEGVAPALRREGPAARLRRGADRHGPHRRSVRLPAHRRRRPT